MSNNKRRKQLKNWATGKINDGKKLKGVSTQGAWVAQWVEHGTLDFR